MKGGWGSKGVALKKGSIENQDFFSLKYKSGN